MITDSARQLTMSLISDITTEKRGRRLSPDYALASEIHAAVDSAVASLTADGHLTRHLASINKVPAYSIPGNNSNTTSHANQ